MKKVFGMLLFMALVAVFAPGAQGQVIVIANNSVKAADVSKSDLKDGSHVTPVLLKSGAANDEFLSAYVGKSDTAFKASWRSLVFSGQATMPKSFDSDAAVVEYVSHTAGAIGYISKGTPHDGVKTLAVR